MGRGSRGSAKGKMGDVRGWEVKTVRREKVRGNNERAK